MFDIPIWQFDLADVIGEVRDQLVEDAVRAVDEMPAANRPFRQSQASLDQFTETWNEVIGMFAFIADGVVQQAFARIDGVSNPTMQASKSWVLRIEGRDAWDHEASQLKIMHNHPGSFLSSVLFLDGPDRPGEPDGGTVFLNPLAHVVDPRLIAPSVTIPWSPMTLLIFPSWLQHGPARPGPSTDARLTVATDFVAG